MFEIKRNEVNKGMGLLNWVNILEKCTIFIKDISPLYELNHLNAQQETIIYRNFRNVYGGHLVTYFRFLL